MPGILHLGVGNFFRAHQAWYTQACHDWRITGVSFRSRTIRDGLAAQDFDYTLLIKATGGTRSARITCMDDVLVAPDDPDRVVAAIASNRFEVITLTVTEKAYHLRPDGALDLTDAAICADLAGGPMTVAGYLTRGLAARQSPVTVLSCDNLPENGRKMEGAVRSFCDAAGLRIGTPVRFPSCMVDRITPATTDADRAEAQDPMAVPTEAFSEWVIEDKFAASRPDWPGVQWVADVAPHELRKLRMLNGAHSYLAYAGTLAGHSFVHEAVADPSLRATVRTLMQEAAKTLPDAVQAQTDAYAAALLHRFDNPALDHRLRQIAMDGSQKMPIRIFATLQDRQGQASPALQSAVAAWVNFVRAEVAAGRPLDDPRRDDLIAACRQEDPETALRALISFAS